MYRLIKSCRACGSTDLIPAFDLGINPLANDFCLPDEPRSGFAPLSILFCPKCTLSQLSVVVEPRVLYSNYKYVTSTSVTMQRHFDRLFQDIASEGATGTMVEIGSNDGTLLRYAVGKGYSVAGIDPAENLCESARKGGVPSICSCFDARSAEHAKELIGTPTVVLTRHCFSHIDNWKQFMADLEVLSGTSTLVAIEAPYVHDMLAKSEFDTCYHEHLSYLTLTAISAILKDSAFRLHRIIKYGIHGGSLLIMLRHKDNRLQQHLSVDEFLGEDRITMHHWERFTSDSKAKIDTLKKTVRELNFSGKRVFAFGASAKGSVWINACGFTSKELLFVTDNSPLKPGCLVPGTDIPIISEELLLSEHPDVAFLSAWNYAPEILEKQKKWRERGGKFLIPTPLGIDTI